jgi:hypothetical protein
MVEWLFGLGSFGWKYGCVKDISKGLVRIRAGSVAVWCGNEGGREGGVDM